MSEEETVPSLNGLADEAFELILQLGKRGLKTRLASMLVEKVFDNENSTRIRFASGSEPVLQNFEKWFKSSRPW
jgi:hypothetical protein